MAGSVRLLVDGPMAVVGSVTYGMHGDEETREESWRRRRAECDGIKRGRAPPANRLGRPIISSNHLATRSDATAGRLSAERAYARQTRPLRLRADRHVAMYACILTNSWNGWSNSRPFQSSRGGSTCEQKTRSKIYRGMDWRGGTRRTKGSIRSIGNDRHELNSYREQARYFAAAKVGDLEIPMF